MKQNVHRVIISSCYRGVMAEGKDSKDESTTGLEGETVSTKKPPQWKRLWGWTGFGEKRLWDWLQMLVVPLLVALIGVLFTAVQQDARQQQLEEQRASAQLQIEEQRRQEAALQTYLDVMRDLLLDEGLRASEPGSSVRAVASADVGDTQATGRGA